MRLTWAEQKSFPLLKLEQLNDQQRPFADEILKVSSIGISGPFNVMLRSPVMAVCHEYRPSIRRCVTVREMKML